MRQAPDPRFWTAAEIEPNATLDLVCPAPALLGRVPVLAFALMRACLGLLPVPVARACACAWSRPLSLCFSFCIVDFEANIGSTSVTPKIVNEGRHLGAGERLWVSISVGAKAGCTVEHAELTLLAVIDQQVSAAVWMLVWVCGGGGGGWGSRVIPNDSTNCVNALTSFKP